MSQEIPGELTRVLNDLDSGDRRAVSELLPIVYADLRRLADKFFRSERDDHTLQPTALVHEAYLHLVQGLDGKFENRVHFFRAAAVTMRHILLKHARDRDRIKRGGNHRRVPLAENLAVMEETEAVDLIAMDDALHKLSVIDARQAQIVELRYFAGLSVAEIGELIGLSVRTVEKEWALAKAWLWREMSR